MTALLAEHLPDWRPVSSGQWPAGGLALWVRLPAPMSSALSAAASRLVITGSGSQTAGAAQALTITATDPYGNTDTGYTGAKNLTFSGASSSTNPVTAPTVTNNAAAAIAFGTATPITFTSGVSTSGGSMKLYKAETANVAVTDGTIAGSTGTDRLTVAVSATAASRLVVTGAGAQTAGTRRP